MNKQKLEKCDFYSSCVNNGERLAIKWSGFMDGNWQYYESKKTKMWYAIDKMTGMSVCAANSRKAVVELAHDKSIMDKFNEFKTTERYEELCFGWYKLLVKCGAYRELWQ